METTQNVGFRHFASGSAESWKLDDARRFAGGSPWLRGFPDDLRIEFLERTRLLPPFRRGQRVYHVGDPPDGIYGVVSGCFGFEIAPQEDGPHLVHQFRPGSWFGDLANVLDRPRLATLHATQPSQCLRVSRNALDDLLRKDPRLWQQLAISLAEAMVLSLTAVNDLLLKSPKRRLSATLLRLAGVRNDEPVEGANLDIDLSHGALAIMTNISRSTVAYYLGELQNDGFLSLRYGRIRLLVPQLLREWLRDPDC